jgi:hypothetical protein
VIFLDGVAKIYQNRERVTRTLFERSEPDFGRCHAKALSSPRSKKLRKRRSSGITEISIWNLHYGMLTPVFKNHSKFKY